MTTNQLIAHALDIWTSNPYRMESSRFALFDKRGVYQKSFSNEKDAHRYVDGVSNTEAWIGAGYRVVKFR